MLTKVELAGTPFWLDEDGKLYPDYLNHGNAMSFVEAVALKYCAGLGIDIGANKWPLRGARAIDLGGGQDAYNLPDVPDRSLDYVFSSHCLEHLERPRDALSLWVRKIKPAGVLFLYLPHPLMKLWRPGGLWVGDGHKWSPDPQTITTMMWEAGAAEFACDPSPDAYWSFWSAARKRA